MPLTYKVLSEYLLYNQLDMLKEAIRTHPIEVLDVMKNREHPLPLLHYACRHSTSEAIHCLLSLEVIA